MERKIMDRQKKAMKVLIIIILVIFLWGTFLSFVSYLMVPTPVQETGDIQGITGEQLLTWDTLSWLILTGENN